MKLVFVNPGGGAMLQEPQPGWKAMLQDESCTRKGAGVPCTLLTSGDTCG